MNQINIYDGLETVPDAITINLDNLNVLDVEGAKIGFIAWEGDVSLSVNESLRMNGYLLSNPPLNPSTNAFNGTNSFTGVSGMHNMDIDVYEHNEAFASASCAVAQEVGIPDDRFNLHGGAVALGHPLGSSGTRCLITMIGVMRRLEAKSGIVSLCLGGGNAVAMRVSIA